MQAAIAFPLLTVLLFFGQQYASTGVAVWSTAPVVDQARMSDIWAGTPVLLLGILQAEAAPGPPLKAKGTGRLGPSTV